MRPTVPPSPDVVYLDTEPLKASEWPATSQQLRRLRDAANDAKASLVIPAPVIEELRQQFVEAIEHLAPMMRRLEGLAGAPSKASLCSHYEISSELAVRELGAEVAATTDRPVQHFMSEAAQRRLPFHPAGKAKDAGFKDSVIWWTCLDHFRRSGFQSAVLVSANPDFPTSYRLEDGRTILRQDAPAVLSRLQPAQVPGPAKGIGWVRIPERGRVVFDFLSGTTRLTNAGGEAGNVSADSGCSPCLSGNTIEVGAYFGGSYIGAGPVAHEGRHWESLHYYGDFTISGPAIVVSGGGSYEGTVSCRGVLTACLGSPMGNAEDILRVSIKGEGRTVLSLSQTRNEAEILFFFQRQEYFFDRVEMNVEVL